MAFQLISVAEAEEGKPPSKWRIRLINAGTSQNGNHYPLQVLHQAAEKFVGARALSRTDEEHVQNKGKDIQKLVGWIDKVIKVPEGLDGIFVAEAVWLRDKIWNAWQLGKKDYIGFSAVADVRGTLMRAAGRTVRGVGQIKTVHFVDAIVNPSAGGNIISLAEAEGKPEGRISLMKIEKLLKLVKDKAPQEYAKLDMENIDEDQLFQIVEALTDTPDPEPKPTATPKAPEPAAPGATIDMDELGKLVTTQVSEATAGIMESMAMQNSQDMAKRMVDGCTLPSKAKKRVMAVLPKDKALTDAMVTEAIDDELDYINENKFKGPGNAMIVEGMVDGMDKYKAALDGFFTGNSELIEGTKDKQSPFISIREAYVELTGDNFVTGDVENASKVSLAAEAVIISTTWGNLLGDALHKAMQREYRNVPYDQWRAIADVVSVSDFRTNNRPQMGGFSALASVAQNGAYVDFTTAPDDFNPSYAVTKYGNLQPITLETIVNDDVGAVQRLPRKMARAAARTLNNNVWAPIINNSNIYDAVALCAAGHGSNITTSALSPATLSAGRTAMMKQAEPQSDERLLLQPKYLAVPVDMDAQAWEYSNSPNKLHLDKSTNTAEENDNTLNFVKSYGLTPLLIPNATDVNNAWLLADKMDVTLMEVGFLGGRQEPELFVQDMPNVGSMFTNDRITYKIRHIYGVVVCDYRGFYMFNVT